MAALNSYRSILDHQAFGRRHTEKLRAFQVRLGGGLAVGHVVGSDEHARDRESGGLEAGRGGPTRARGDHRPAVLGQRLEEFYGARHHDDAIAVIVA